jgi:AbrB family looped-hinge helix DNA binding protein
MEERNGMIIFKETGIVRRIDDLGRVVIPRDIRKVCGIKEGDALEICCSKDGIVMLRKYIAEEDK